MPEIEAELSKSIPCEHFKLIAGGGITQGQDLLEISRLTFNNSEAATLAWLINQLDGTLLKLEIKIAT